jgi:hypothetical protein
MIRNLTIETDDMPVATSVSEGDVLFSLLARRPSSNHCAPSEPDVRPVRPNPQKFRMDETVKRPLAEQALNTAQACHLAGR